ncbi:putative MFS transporter [Thozetella sp. PMI_491]|nr:putative MFS transporter [Thozetella sp. PMI_491]
MPALADPNSGEREPLLAREADGLRRPGLDAAIRDITASEHDLSFWNAVKRHPYAVLWSLLFSLAVVMAGFDAQLVTSLYALPAFQRRFGYEHDGHYIISAGWQTALGMGSPVGQVLGALACDYPLESLGRRVTLALCCVWSVAFVFVQYFSTSIEMLCAGEVLGGLAYGFYVVVAPTYASEVCPLALRGVLAAAVNLAFVVGQFIAQASCAAFENRLDEGAYKALFAIQWIWPAALLIGLAFAPESPYWLVRKGRDDDARAALARLASPKYQLDVDQHLAMIQHTDRLERELTETTTYMDCFSDANLLRTEISVMVYLIQVVAGNPLIGYANFFFEMAGLDSADAFMMGIVNVVLGFVGTCVSWVLINYWGRRTIYNNGLALMTVILFVIGVLDFGRSQSAVVWAQASLLDFWTLIYQMTVGPICFVIISEISATRLRARTIAVATAVQALAGVVFTFALPYMLTSDQADWRGKTGFFFGAISIVCYIWCWFRLPESRGRTFEELDILFSRNVPPRRFASYDLLAEGQSDDSDQ